MKNGIIVILLGLTLVISAIYITGVKASGFQVARNNAILPREGAITTSSDDSDGDGVPDNIEQSNIRSVTVQQNGNEFQIESTLKNGEDHDQIELQVRPDGEGIKIQLQYQHEAQSSEVELSFEVRFRALVEYIDANANKVYDPSVDTLVQTLNLDNFAAPTYYVVIIDGANVHYLHIQTSDGIFGIHAYVPEEFSIVNGTLVTPTQMKIDIEIISFPYINGTSDLALYVQLSSESEYGVEENTHDEQSGYASGESEVETSSGGSYTGIFSWATTATIDGTTTNVATTSLATDDHVTSDQKMYICYPRGIHIYHDPKLGVVSGLQAPADWTWLFVLAGIAGAAVVIGVVIAKKRR